VEDQIHCYNYLITGINVNASLHIKHHVP